MQDVFKVHDVARIRTGRYAGLLGTVTDTRFAPKSETGFQTVQTQVRVRVEGVRDEQTVTAHVWLKRSNVERNSNGN